MNNIRNSLIKMLDVRIEYSIISVSDKREERRQDELPYLKGDPDVNTSPHSLHVKTIHSLTCM